MVSMVTGALHFGIGGLIYFNQDKLNSTQNLNNQIIEELNWRYQKLSSSKKRLFLRKTGLDIASSLITDTTNDSLKDLIAKHLDQHQDRLSDDLTKNMFLNKLLNEIENLTDSRNNLITTANLFD